MALESNRTEITVDTTGTTEAVAVEFPPAGQVDIGIQSPVGLPGPPGPPLRLRGEVATEGDLPGGAADGDSYLVLDTGHLWSWDQTNTMWVDAGQHVGPTGPQGPEGPEGPEGPQGIQGVQGDPGPAVAEGGITQTDADARYVNATGDTMTGPLVVTSEGTPTLTLDTSTAYADRHTYKKGVSWMRERAYVDSGFFLVTGPSYYRFGMPVQVEVPAAATQVPRLARTPDPATGDLGLPGYAGSDTGWRDVSASLLNSWTGSLHVRRVGSAVALRMAISGASATNAQCSTLPTGFRMASFPGRHLFPVSSNASAPPTPFISAGVFAANGTDVKVVITASTVYGATMLTTDDPWPTSLPGTEVTPPASWT